MKIKRIICIMFISLLILEVLGGLIGNVAYADENDWWTKASEFVNSGKANDVSGVTGAISSIKGFIQFVGNIIFFVVTIFLGVKYIWGSVESKASVKDSLITLVVAAAFFYGWTTIEGLINIDFGTTYASSFKQVYATLAFIGQVLALGGLVYVGIRYMLAGAEGKSQIKAKAIPIVLGIVMVFSTFTFLSFIVNTISNF